MDLLLIINTKINASARNLVSHLSFKHQEIRFAVEEDTCIIQIKRNMQMYAVYVFLINMKYR